MVPQNSLVTNFLQNIFLCVRKNKDIHTGLELLEDEYIFWVNYPFKHGRSQSRALSSLQTVCWSFCSTNGIKLRTFLRNRV